MISTFIALGSNLGDPFTQLKSALLAIRELAECELLACSPVYRSAAVGPGEQPDYLNAVAHLRTGLAPIDLLRALQAIEAAQGRERQTRWGARTLDLDILLYGDLVVGTTELTVPHPRLKERNFVLYPLGDIDPNLILPCGTPIKALLECSPANGLRRHSGPLSISHSDKEG